jgi:hypothetical protein
VHRCAGVVHDLLDALAHVLQETLVLALRLYGVG